MGLVLLGATVRRSRAAPGAYVPPITGFHDVAFVWDTVATADSYTLEVGTATGQKDTYDNPVGNVITKTLSLQGSRTYFSRVKAYNGVTLLETKAEQSVTI
jgi:hypothetical protein